MCSGSRGGERQRKMSSLLLRYFLRAHCSCGKQLSNILSPKNKRGKYYNWSHFPPTLSNLASF